MAMVASDPGRHLQRPSQDGMVQDRRIQLLIRRRGGPTPDPRNRRHRRRRGPQDRRNRRVCQLVRLRPQGGGRAFTDPQVLLDSGQEGLLGVIQPAVRLASPERHLVGQQPAFLVVNRPASSRESTWRIRTCRYVSKALRAGFLNPSTISRTRSRSTSLLLPSANPPSGRFPTTPAVRVRSWFSRSDRIGSDWSRRTPSPFAGPGKTSSRAIGFREYCPNRLGREALAVPRKVGLPPHTPVRWRESGAAENRVHRSPAPASLPALLSVRAESPGLQRREIRSMPSPGPGRPKRPTTRSAP